MLVELEAEATLPTAFSDAAKFDTYMRRIEQLIDICRVAQAQGMPDDPAACRAYVRARPKTMLVPSTIPSM